MAFLSLPVSFLVFSSERAPAPAGGLSFPHILLIAVPQDKGQSWRNGGGGRGTQGL